MVASNPDERPYPLPEKFSSGRIGVVTVTYNSQIVLPDFIASIEQQSYTNFCLYAIDNASNDNTLLLLADWKDERFTTITNPTNVGVAAGNNQGIRAAIDAGCEYVMLLNNDVVFGPDMFERLLNGLAAKRCDMAVPMIYFFDRPEVVWCAGGFFQPKLGYRTLHYGEGKTDTGQFAQSRLITYAPTCCVVIHRSVFGSIGLMDERYFVYSDDVDFMLRAMQAGKTMYCLPEPKLWHKVNSLTGTESPFSMRYGVRNRAFFIAKYLRQPSVAFLNVLYPAYYLLRYIFRRDTRAALRIKQKAWAEGRRIIGQ